MSTNLENKTTKHLLIKTVLETVRLAVIMLIVLGGILPMLHVDTNAPGFLDGLIIGALLFGGNEFAAIRELGRRSANNLFNKQSK